MPFTLKTNQLCIKFSSSSYFLLCACGVSAGTWAVIPVIDGRCFHAVVEMQHLFSELRKETLKFIKYVKDIKLTANTDNKAFFLPFQILNRLFKTDVCLTFELRISQ